MHYYVGSLYRVYFFWCESCFWFGCLLSLSSECSGCYPLDRRCEGAQPMLSSRQVGEMHGISRQSLLQAVPNHQVFGSGGNPQGGGGSGLNLVAGPKAVAVMPRKLVAAASHMAICSSNVVLHVFPGRRRQQVVHSCRVLYNSVDHWNGGDHRQWLVLLSSGVLRCLRWLLPTLIFHSRGVLLPESPCVHVKRKSFYASTSPPLPAVLNLGALLLLSLPILPWLWNTTPQAPQDVSIQPTLVLFLRLTCKS